LSSQRIQAASANFRRENSSGLDSENFSSYFSAREIVNREKRKKEFRDVNNEKFEIKLRELLGIHRNDFLTTRSHLHYKMTFTFFQISSKNKASEIMQMPSYSSSNSSWC
jgi:hypothetical protein